jgi:RHS repeat-associated protein
MTRSLSLFFLFAAIPLAVTATFRPGDAKRHLVSPHAAEARSGLSAAKLANAAWRSDKIFGVNPIVSTAPQNGFNRNVSMCVANCGDLVVSHTIPFYVSLGVDRSVTMLYNQGQAYAVTTVAVDAQDTSTTRTANIISLKVLDSTGTVLRNQLSELETFFSYTQGSWRRLASRLNSRALPTGAYNYTAVVTSYYTDSTSTSTSVPVRIIVVNENSSPYGGGWTVAGLQRLHFQTDGSTLLTDGTGTVQYYAGPCATAPCSFTSPLGEFSSLSRHATSGGDTTIYSRRSPNGDVVSFYGNGLEAYTFNRFGDTTKYAYDSFSRLSAITDPTGHAMSFSYAGTSGAGGPLITITDPGGRVTSMSLDTASNLVSIQDPAGGLPFQGAYFGSSSHLMMHWTDRRGGVWAPGYDCTAHGNGVQEPSVIVNGSSANPRIYVNDRDVASTACSSSLNGSSAGLGATKATPAPAVSPDSIRSRVTTAGGASTKFAVDVFGAPIRIEEPLGQVTIIDRDTNSRPTRVISPNGHVVAYTYSSTLPNLNRVVDSTTGRVVNFAYDSTHFDLLLHAWGNTPEIVDTVDSQNLNIITQVLAGTGTTRYAFDTHGRVDSIVDPSAHVTKFTYAALGLQNLSGVSTALGSTSILQNAFGRDSIVTDPEGHAFRTLYDALGRIARTIGPVSDTTRYDYDSLYMFKVHDATGQILQYNRNALGWLDSLTDMAGHVEHYQYTVDGDVSVFQNRRGLAVSFVYDSLQRTIEEDTSSVAIASYGYASNLAFMTLHNAVGTDTVWLDKAGRDTARAMWRGAHRYRLGASFNVDDNRTALNILPWSTSLAWHYDTAQRVDTLTNLDGKKTAIRYNPDWAVDTVTLPTVPALTIGQAYPATHTPSQVSYSDTTLQRQFGVWFGYDTVGHVSQRINQVTSSSVGGREFSHDPLGRLTGYATFAQTLADMTCSDPTWIVNPVTGQPCNQSMRLVSDSTAMSYDKVGNRNDSSAVVTAGDRLVRFKGDSLTYDADGNLTRHWTIAGGFEQDFHWNLVGQLDSVVTNGSAVRFTYDPSGRRASKSVGGTTVVYVWDGNDLIATADTAGNRIDEFTPSPADIDVPHSVRHWVSGSAKMYYYPSEFPGHMMGLIDTAAKLVNQYTYRPFGDISDTTVAVQNVLRFGGRELDESGLYFLRARYYDPRLKRFVSEDPAKLDGGINPYVYAANDPVDARDPLGLTTSTTTTFTDWGDDWSSWWYWFIRGLGGAGGGPSGAGGGGGSPSGSQSTTCGTGGFGGGIGLIGSGSAQAGGSLAGAMSTSFVGGGMFLDSRTGLSDGLFAGGVNLMYALAHISGSPAQTAQPSVIGASAEAGVSIFFTNARSVQQLSGPFTTYAINVGFGPAQSSIQLASAGSIWMASFSPPGAGVAMGGSYTQAVTNTISQQRGCK